MRRTEMGFMRRGGGEPSIWRRAAWKDAGAGMSTFQRGASATIGRGQRSSVGSIGISPRRQCADEERNSRANDNSPDVVCSWHDETRSVTARDAAAGRKQLRSHSTPATG